MDNLPLIIAEENPTAVPPVAAAQRANRWLRIPFAADLTPARVKTLTFSLADQALTVGGIFLVNVVLARTQTKEEYGMFALSYSVFTFLAGLHNAAILEPYTVYGSGRYRKCFSGYFRLMLRSNALVAAVLTALLLMVCVLFRWMSSPLASRALVGLGLSVGFLLTGAFLRRTFYLRRQAANAARVSLVYFITVAIGLLVATRTHVIDSLSVFLILALGWITAGAVSARKLPFGKPQQSFFEVEPRYWPEHWRYSRWVLATAFVFQLTNQGYYWLVAGFLSVKEVAELKAMYILIAPVEQVMISMSFLLVPVLASHYAAKRMGNFLSVWKRYGLAAVGITGFFALAVRILGKQVMHVLYAGKFDDLVPLLFTLAFLPLLMGIGNTVSDALKASEKPNFVLYAYLCSGALTFLGGIPLVVHFGLRGAVYGMLLSGATYSSALALGFYFEVRRKAQQQAAPPNFNVVTPEPPL